MYLTFITTFLLTITASFGQTVCSGSLSGNFDGISVTSGTCNLNGVTVTGSVEVNSGASLSISGSSEIRGNLFATNGGNINIGGTTTVSGDVSVQGSPTSMLTVGPSASLTTISLENSGSLLLQGKVGSVNTKSSGFVNVNGGNITSGGLLIDMGTGGVSFCDASVTGGISMIQQNGVIRTAPDCPPSTITGSVNIDRGNGNVQLSGANIDSGDVLINDREGDITISGSTVSDVSIAGTKGTINLNSITTDSDVSIIENEENVAIDGSTFGGDVRISLNSAVQVTGSKFSGESVSISNTDGLVTFSNNSEGSVSITQGLTTVISNNNLEAISVGSNSGPVSITGNQVETLTCVDNVPPPTGFGNIVSVLADGQCTGF